MELLLGREPCLVVISGVLVLSLFLQCVDMWKRSPCNLAVPSEVDVSQLVTCASFPTRLLCSVGTHTWAKESHFFKKQNSGLFFESTAQL